MLCRSKTELAGARFEEDMGRVGFCKLVRDDLGAVWGAVVDDDEFPIKVPVIHCQTWRMADRWKHFQERTAR